jgi:hypothetical protein
MFDFVFGGKKKLNLVRAIIEKSMKDSGLDGLESRAQVKNLSNFELIGTPAGIVVNIIDLVLEAQQAEEII